MNVVKSVGKAFITVPPAHKPSVKSRVCYLEDLSYCGKNINVTKILKRTSM